MPRSTVLLVAALLATGCHHGGADLPITGNRGDPYTVTSAELKSAAHVNLYDFVAAQRPRWLVSPNARALPIFVYMDDAQLGGIATLKSLTPGMLSSIRYYDASAAQQRFNIHNVGPVIQLIAR